MALDDTDRRRVTRGLMRWWSRFWELTSFSEPELFAAVGDTDDFIDSIQTGYNSALPEPFQTLATVAQKTFVFCAVAIFRVSPAFARMVFGKVD